MRDQTYKILRAVLESDPTVPETRRERIIAAAAGDDIPVTWVSEAEAARLLGLSKSALQQWRFAGGHKTAGKFPFTVLKTAMGTYVYDPGEISHYNRLRLRNTEDTAAQTEKETQNV